VNLGNVLVEDVRNLVQGEDQRDHRGQDLALEDHKDHHGLEVEEDLVEEDTNGTSTKKENNRL
jgi:hypothetical protein